MNIKHPSKKLEAIFEACLWKFRLFALIPVIFGLLSSLNFFVVGSIEILEGLSHNFPHDYIDEHSFTKAVASIIGGVDHDLIGVVLLLFGFGIYEIFISPIEINFRYKGIKILEVVNTLDGLKRKILQVVIMALIIGFFKRALSIPIESQQDLQSTAICILLIAVSSYLVHLQSHGGRSRAMGVPTERQWREKYRQNSPGFDADLIAKDSNFQSHINEGNLNANFSQNGYRM
ncbi:MAG: YqhA family protein [Pseudanabaenales cyanobacterium]|nr:YqhA family protein [Pseudanabaenales cyanobacterium]